MAARKIRLLSISELATTLGVSRLGVYRMRDCGMPGYRVGGGRGVVRYDLEQVLRWCEQREKKYREDGYSLPAV